MKKNYKFLLAAFAIVAAASCAKEIAPERESTYNGNLVPIVLSATGEETTKTTLGQGRSVLWQEGDKVSVLDNKGAWGALAVSAGAGTSTATLSGSIAEGATELWALYPDSAVGAFQNGVAGVTIPATQTVSAATPADPAALIAAAHTTDLKSLQFKNMTSLVQFTVAAEDAITAVVIKGNANETIAGSFYVNTKEVTITTDQTGETFTSVKVVPSSGTFAAGTYYAVVAPVEFTSGITVTFEKEEGAAIAVKSSTTAATLERNSGINLGKIAPETWIPVQIRNGAELKAFSENVAKYPAGTNVVIANDIDMSGVTIEATQDTLKANLDGQNYSINNWESTCPIIAVTAKGTEVKNIVIGATSSLKPAPGNYGAIVGRSYGNVSKCVNNAPLTITDTECTQYVLGTLVGRLEAAMVDCENTADVTVNLSNSTATADEAKSNYVGGLVGMCATPQDADRITGSKNSGNITLNVTGAPTDEGCRIKHGFVGGIFASTGLNTPSGSETSGYAKNYGTFSNCENSGNITYNHPDGGSGAYALVGGIAGYVEGHINGCTNSGAAKYVNSMDVQNSKPAVGGIAGTLAFSASNCVNSGDVVLEGLFANGSGVTATSCLGNIYSVVGGCFGAVGIDATEIDNCDNSGAIKINGDMPVSNKSAVGFGGIVGNQCSTSCTVKNCDNTGAMDIKNGTYTANIAGVVGYNYGSTVNCTNSGDIIVNHETTDLTDPASATVNFGGLVGYNRAEVAGCTNNGNLSLNASGNVRLGGVVGMYGAGTYDCTGCVNNGTITFVKTADIKKLSYVAGVVGCMNILYSLIDCVNNGAVTVTSTKSSTASYCGGVTSYTLGANITNCSNTADITVDGGAATTQYFVGGVLGCNKKGANNCLINNCSNSGKVTLTNHKSTSAFVYVGGVHGGYASSNPSLTNCTNTGDVLADCESAVRIGGVTGAGNSLLANCKNTANVTMMNGKSGSGKPVEIGLLAGYFSGTQVDGSVCEGTLTANGNTGAQVGVCFGALGATTRTWQNLTINAAVTTDQQAGYFCGDASTGKYTLGAEGAPVVIKKTTTINGAAVPDTPAASNLAATNSTALTIVNVVVE